MEAMRLCHYSPQVSLSTSSVFRRVAVENLFPEPTLRYADPVVSSGNWGEVAGDHDGMVWASGLANEARDALFPILNVEPFEPISFKVQLVQGQFCTV